MFTAKGGAVTKLPSQQYQVRVDYYADATPLKPILSRQYVVAGQAELTPLINQQLTELKQAADDALFNMDIVGKTLGSI